MLNRVRWCVPKAHRVHGGETPLIESVNGRALLKVGKELHIGHIGHAVHKMWKGDLGVKGYFPSSRRQTGCGGVSLLGH